MGVQTGGWIREFVKTERIGGYWCDGREGEGGRREESELFLKLWLSLQWHVSGVVVMERRAAGPTIRSQSSLFSFKCQGVVSRGLQHRTEEAETNR